MLRKMLAAQQEKTTKEGARVNWSVVRDRCTRVQGYPRNLFRRSWIFGLSSQKHHT